MPENDKYKFKVNKEMFEVDDPSITARTILTMAGKSDVTKHALYMKIQGQQRVKIENLDDPIDLSQAGLERFKTLPLEQTEGEAAVAVNILPEEDIVYLALTKLDWELVPEGAIHWLVIRDYPIPAGYNFGKADVSLRLERCYPDVQIDMVYFSENLTLLSGRPIRQLTSANHLGRVWQRWSRHRTAQNPWRTDVDCVETHMALVDDWLMREMR